MILTVCLYSIETINYEKEDSRKYRVSCRLAVLRHAVLQDHLPDAAVCRVARVADVEDSGRQPQVGESWRVGGPDHRSVGGHASLSHPFGRQGAAAVC